MSTEKTMSFETINAVLLSGRVSVAPQARILPSGDEVVSFRLIVPRSTEARRRSKQLVDTIECSAWTEELRRSVRSLEAGDQMTVRGELRRRFSRGRHGPMSWVSVDLTACEHAADAATADT